jgi:hypothetical protein
MKSWTHRAGGQLLIAIAFFMAACSMKAADPVAAPQPPNPPPTDKSGFTLWRPTPRELMRELSPDRPDKTESPYTVDAGHFQLEMDVLNYSYDRYTPERDHTRFERVTIAPLNLKVGVLNNLDLHLGLESYTSTRSHDLATGDVETHRGFGDVVPRVKINLWGNDGGKTAGALMPFVKLPTNQDHLGNNSVEAGVILPLAVELPLGFGMGLMTEFDWNRDVNGDGHHTEFVNSITFGHDIVGDLGGYVEFFSGVSAERGVPWVGSVDLGLAYALTADVHLDAGINIGLTRSAEDLNPFLGLTWRF